MAEIIWKSFRLGDLFRRSTELAIGLNQKDLNLTDEKDSIHSIALISASRSGSGRVGYIDSSLVNRDIISINKLSFDDQWGFTYFQQEPFVITGGHNAILEVINPNLRTLLDANLFIYSFISLIINKITIKSEIFGYGYKINNKFDREIILLPCLEVAKGKDFIWEENSKHYTLAVEYIKKLMEQAKELHEQKTIRLYEAERKKYEAERKKYEAERKKYEAEYNQQKNNIIWKGFKLGDFLDFSSKHTIKTQIKNVQIYESREEGTVANVTASKENNGIVGYIEENEEIRNKKVKNVLTIAPDAAYAGVCFYQPDYVVSTGHNKVIDISNENIKMIFDGNIYLYMFLSKLLTKMFCKTVYGFSKSITDTDFRNSLILLPCLEVAKGKDFIWEEDGKYYTLAVEYISYLYLTGKVNYNQKLVDNYTYQY